MGRIDLRDPARDEDYTAQEWAVLRDRVKRAQLAADPFEALRRARPETAIEKGCYVEGCERPHKARGLCIRHYHSHRRAA